jgi:hypothetical protein
VRVGGLDVLCDLQVQVRGVAARRDKEGKERKQSKQGQFVQSEGRCGSHTGAQRMHYKNHIVN